RKALPVTALKNVPTFQRSNVPTPPCFRGSSRCSRSALPGPLAYLEARSPSARPPISPSSTLTWNGRLIRLCSSPGRATPHLPAFGLKAARFQPSSAEGSCLVSAAKGRSSTQQNGCYCSSVILQKEPFAATRFLPA